MKSLDLASEARLFSGNELSVLFVTSQLRPRELKMADGLRRIGWKVGLVYNNWTPFDPSGYFDFSIEAGSAEEAHRCAQALSPKVCHVFSGAIDDVVLLFCRNKPAPVVIDLNDVFAPSLFDYCHERFELTQEALALADGFCARDLQVKRAERVDGFLLPPHMLLFPEYCWNAGSVRGKLEQEVDSEEVHVVSVGTFSLETQGMYDSCYLTLARLIVDQKINLHIYPHWSYRKDHHGSPHANLERDFSDFFALERSSSYLHMHESLPIEQLAKVLPRYDFGIVSGGCPEFGQSLKFYKPAYLETCYSGRISDYLDARLPVLINREVAFDFWLLRHYGVCVNLKGILRPGFKEGLLAFKRDKERRVHLDKAAYELSIDANTPRLGRFYSKIAEATSEIRTYVKAGGFKTESITPFGSNDAGGTSVVRANDRSLLVRRLVAVAKAHSPKFARKFAKLVLPYREIQLLETYAHNAKLESTAAQHTNAVLRSQIGELEQKSTRLCGQVEDLKKNNTVFGVQIESLKEGNAELSAQIEDLEQNEVALVSQVGGLEQQNASLRSRLDELKSRAQELERDNEKLCFQVGAYEQHKVALQSKVELLEQNNGSLYRQVQELAQRNTELTLQLENFSQISAVLGSKVEILERNNAAHLLHIEGLEQKDASLRSEAEQFRQDVVALRLRLETLEQTNAVLRSQAEALDRNNVAHLSHIKELERNELALHSKINDLEQNSATLGSQVRDLEQENAGLRSQAETMEQQLGSLIQQNQVLNNEKLMLRQEIRWGRISVTEMSGALNWLEILDDVERSNGFAELVRILRLFSASKHDIDRPSTCWDMLALKNYDQLLSSGYDNFKRTIGHNYFNFLVQKGDPQIQALESLLSSKVKKICWDAASAGPDDPVFPWHDQVNYRYFVLLLWEYAKTIDTKGHLDLLQEPAEGTPILIRDGKRTKSQDLANSLIEYYSMSEAVPFERITRVLEIGCGYGRTAHVILTLNPQLKMMLVDIPPALFVAQRYLASVFKTRHVFKVRDFSRYEEVRGEMENASIVFLMPHQLALMPNHHFDLGLNISSFGEMTKHQIQWYFNELGRVMDGHFYMKQWHVSKNPYDDIELKQDDYPYPKDWQRIYSRPCKVQSEFFETLYRTGKP